MNLYIIYFGYGNFGTRLGYFDTLQLFIDCLRVKDKKSNGEKIFYILKQTNDQF